MAAAKGPSQSSGPSTDRYNDPVIDPTANVIALTNAAVGRLNDLREADQRYAETQFAHITEVANLRAEHSAALRKTETERIDAIRAVDVGAVQRAAEVAAEQASTLANQVATSAETLRAQVAAAATAAQINLAAALVPIQQRIDDLSRAQYEAQGQKTQVVESRAASGAIYAAVGFGLSLLLTMLTVIGFLVANQP